MTTENNNKENFKRIVEIYKIFGVSRRAVYYWIDGGLETKIKRVIGKKPYRVIDTHEVVRYLGIEDKAEYHK